MAGFVHRDVRSNALALLTASEGLVLYPYDDMAKRVRVKGKGLVVPEHKGGPLVGTLTQGYGHTNMAGEPRIEVGKHWTKEYALEVLNKDLDKYEDEVTRDVKVPLNDNQFGCLVDFNFNCGRGNLRKLIIKLNEGDYEDVPVRIMRYTRSKGIELPGLVKRRQAEAALWRSYTDVAQQQAKSSEHDETPKLTVDDAAPERNILQSQEATGNATLTTANTANSTFQTVKDVANQAREFKDTVGFEPDWLDYIGMALGSPWVWVGVLGLGVGGYMFYRTWRRLKKE